MSSSSEKQGLVYLVFIRNKQWKMIQIQITFIKNAVSFLLSVFCYSQIIVFVHTEDHWIMLMLGTAR